MTTEFAFSCENGLEVSHTWTKNEDTESSIFPYCMCYHDVDYCKNLRHSGHILKILGLHPTSQTVSYSSNKYTFCEVFSQSKVPSKTHSLGLQCVIETNFP